MADNELLPVTQADREAAADQLIADAAKQMRAVIDDGYDDETALATALESMGIDLFAALPAATTDNAELVGAPAWADPSVDMGTAAEAETALIEAIDRWIDLRQPLIASEKAHRQREHQEREARFRLANAAAHWAWFKRDPRIALARTEQQP